MGPQQRGVHGIYGVEREGDIKLATIDLITIFLPKRRSFSKFQVIGEGQSSMAKIHGMRTCRRTW